MSGCRIMAGLGVGANQFHPQRAAGPGPQSGVWTVVTLLSGISYGENWDPREGRL